MQKSWISSFPAGVWWFGTLCKVDDIAFGHAVQIGIIFQSRRAGSGNAENKFGYSSR